MSEELEIKKAMQALENELRTISKDLQRAIDVASKNIWVKQNQPIPGLGRLHQGVTKRSDEILDQIKILQKRLLKIKPS